MAYGASPEDVRAAASVSFGSDQLCCEGMYTNALIFTELRVATYLLNLCPICLFFILSSLYCCSYCYSVEVNLSFVEIFL